MKYYIRNLVFTLMVISFFVPNLHSQVFDLKGDTAVVHLPEVVVTANRYQKNIYETHIPADIVSKKETWQRGISSVGELIERSPGINYTTIGPWSQKLILRGLSNSQVLTLIDGMKLDVLRSYGNHAPLIDPESIERVEIIRGPASVLYGSDAIGGVVNIITKNTRSMQTDFAVKANAGVQYHSVNQQSMANLNINGQLNKFNFLLNLGHRKADDVETPTGTLINTAYEGLVFDGKAGYQLNKMHHVELRTQLNRMKDVGVPVNQFASSAKFKTYNRDLVSVLYDYQNPQSKWNSVRANAFFQKGARNFDALVEGVPTGPLFVRQLLNANRDVKSYGGHIQTTIIPFSNNIVTAGLDLFTEFDDTRRIADVEIYNDAGAIVKNPPADLTPPTPESNRKGVAVFIENEYSPFKRWTFTLGSRFDRIYSHANATTNTLAEQSVDKTDADVSASAGALYRLSNNIRLTVNVGRAFKAPTLQERFFRGTAQVGFLNGNPDLKSETSLNADAGLKWNFSRFSGEFSFYRNRIDDFIVMNPVNASADTFQYANVGEAELFGGEVQTRFQISRGMVLFANASYVKGDDVQTDTPLPKIPPLRTIFGLRYEPDRGHYWLEFDGRFVVDQERVAENEIETDGYQLYDLSTGVNVGNLLQLKNAVYLTFNIKNIFDESYRDHLSYVTWWDAPGRNFIMGLRTEF